MKIIIYLYYEIYLNKNPKFIDINTRLSKITNIAKRKIK